MIIFSSLLNILTLNVIISLHFLILTPCSDGKNMKKFEFYEAFLISSCDGGIRFGDIGFNPQNASFILS